MNTGPRCAHSLSGLLALVGASTALAQPAAEVEYLAVRFLIPTIHQSTPPAPVVPSSFGSIGGIDVFPPGKMTMSFNLSSPVKTTFVVDGASLTPIFPAGEQAQGMPAGRTYQGGIVRQDNNNRMDPSGNYSFMVPLLNPTGTVNYWGPLNNLQPLAAATRVGPTRSGWWLKAEGATGNVYVGHSPDATTVRIAAGQRPLGLPAAATNLSMLGWRLFDGGEVALRLSTSGGNGHSYYCIADSTSYRVVSEVRGLIPDLGFYFLEDSHPVPSCSAGGDQTILSTASLGTSSNQQNPPGAIWKTDREGHSTLLAMHAQQAPALPPGVLVDLNISTAFSPTTSAMIDANGDVLAWFNLTGAGVTPANRSALVLFDHQGAHLLLRAGDTIRFGDQNVVVPAICGPTPTGAQMDSWFWMNRRGDIAMWTGPKDTLDGLIATYNKRTGWVGLAASHTLPISGFNDGQQITQLFECFVTSISPNNCSSGYDMGMRRLDDDGWVYFAMNLNGSVFATKARAILPPCPADFNSDGAVDFFDYDDFVACFEGLACPPNTTADFDHDGSVDFFDYDAFVIAFESPC